MSELLRAQMSFGLLLPRLLDRAIFLGFRVTLGETWRPNAMVELNALAGIGSRASLHPLRLAVDLQLFKAGRWLTTTDDHRTLGEWWERLRPDCRWGGRFGDGNHYSLAWEGRA